MAIAPKSNAVYNAYKSAKRLIAKTGSLDVPKHIRNAPTQLMKDLDYAKNYRYAHDEDEGYAAGESYLPDAIQDEHFYYPVERGMEIKIKEKMQHLRKLDESAKSKESSKN